MCLLSKQDKLEIAKKDIECYKFVIVDDKNNYRTPFMNIEIKYDVINGNKPFEPNEETSAPITSDLHTSYLWAKGLIHAYRKYGSCYDAAKYFESFYISKYLLYCGAMPTKTADIPKISCAIYKCIIPSGTEYVKGCTGDIAARKIMFIRIVARKKLSIQRVL